MINARLTRLAIVVSSLGLLALGDPGAVWARQAGSKTRQAEGQAGSPGREAGAGTRQAPRGGRGIGGLRAGQMTPQQLDQAFDRFMVAQARTALQLSPEQVGAFGSRLEALQVVRRRAQRQRRLLVQELNELTQRSDTMDDTVVAEKLQALDDQAARASREIREAYQGLDAVLTPAQRARFRAFELRMEQRKLELIARARQNARPQAPSPPPP